MNQLHRIRVLPDAKQNQTSAFTRFECCAMIGAIALLTALALPALASGRLRSERLVCVSNLGEIGRGYNIWASEHGDHYPFEINASEGGIRWPYNGLENNAWFQFSWVSNELRTARILACPSDVIRHTATNFSTEPNGLLHPNNRNNSISYFLGRPFYPDGNVMLAGDRNLAVRSFGGSSFFGNPVARANSREPIAWDSRIHNRSGNILHRDGAVDQASNVDLMRQVSYYGQYSGLTELLLP